MSTWHDKQGMTDKAIFAMTREEILRARGELDDNPRAMPNAHKLPAAELSRHG